MLLSLYLSLLAGLSTALGWLAIILVGTIGGKVLSLITGSVTGMMLVFSFLSLLTEAMELAGLSTQLFVVAFTARNAPRLLTSGKTLNPPSSHSRRGMSPAGVLLGA